MKSKKVTGTLTFNEARLLQKDPPVYLAHSDPLPLTSLSTSPPSSLSLGSAPDVLRLLCSTRLSRKEMPCRHLHQFGKFPPSKARTHLCTALKSQWTRGMKHQEPAVWTKWVCIQLYYNSCSYCTPKLRQDKGSPTWLRTPGQAQLSPLSERCCFPYTLPGQDSSPSINFGTELPYRQNSQYLLTR